MCAYTVTLHFLVVGVGVLGVEGLVGPHDGHEVVGRGQVGYAVRHPRRHFDHGRLRAGDAVLVHGVRVPPGVEPDAAQADERLAGDHQELLPLAVVPVVPLGHARFGDVHGHLPPLGRAQELRERPAPVAVRMQRVREGARAVVALEGRPELLAEGPLGQVGHRQVVSARPEGLQQAHDLAERRAVGRRHEAVLPVGVGDGFEAVIAAAVLLTEQRTEHLLHEVVDVEELQLDRRVADGVVPIVGDGVAEGCDGGVVPGAAPLAVEVREAVDEHRRARALRIVEEQLLARTLGLAVGAALVAARQRRLDAGGQHHRAAVAVALQQVEQFLAESAVALHELGGVLRAVHSREVEHEVRLRAVEGEPLPGAVLVVLVDGEWQEGMVALPPVLAVAYGLQELAEVAPDEALGTRHQNLHYWIASLSLPSSASCTYSAVLIFSTVSATVSLLVLWLV